MKDNWQQKRSVLNHDWLKNEFIKLLDSFILDLASMSNWNTREEMFLREDLTTWETNSPEIRMLLLNAESALSPSTFLDRPPLNACPHDTKDWLGPLIHHLWLVRVPVKQWISEALNAYEESEKKYLTIQKNLKLALKNNAMDLKPEFERFADAVLKLSKAISRLPHKIEVV